MSRISHSSAPNLQEPGLVLGDAGFGRQRNSLRPSSAKYSFPRGPGHDEGAKNETPGPCDYDVSDYASALGQASAIIGTSARIEFNKDYHTAAPNAQIADAADADNLRYPAAPAATFGNEARDAELLVDPEIIRACPESRFGREGPGFLYTPDDRRVRPGSAPAFSMRQAPRVTQSAPLAATPETVSPAQYGQQAAFGVQRDSRRKNARTTSFSRASRFPAPKPPGGELTAECQQLDSCFGRGCTTRKGVRKAPAATFGSATRTSSARARLSTGPGDCPTAASRLGPARMHHEPVAPRKEILRYNALQMPMR